MKKIFLFASLTISLFVNAQILDPVSWKTSTKQLSNNEFELVMEAAIEPHWHMFSQFTPDGGSLPSVFEYKNAKGNFELVGKTTESKYEKVYNDIFEVDEYIFENKATFKQKVKVTNSTLKEIKVYVEYQACKEQCIQLDKTFTFKLPEIKTAESNTKVENVIVETTSDLVIETVTIDTTKQTISDENNKEEVKVSEDNITTTKEVEKEEEKRSLWSIFIFAFLGGFAALLTPCVFPMIPMTVSFFTKHSGSRQKGIFNALFYGISIIVIYVFLGLLVTGIFGADALNALSTSVIFNVIFFIILIFFASSFLGAFEIVLPNSLANIVDKKSSKSGIIGIFFMAMALAIVSFSCTGPIVGTLLVEAASKGGIAPIVGMFGFSLAIALPFMLFALFPAWMNSLPKSGGWLNTVKVSLGFLELALAFKFLSNADLVLQAHWLEREVFLTIWIVIFGTWAVYLFGKLTLPHDSPVTHISVGRLFLALLVSIFTVYLIPGLWGAPLKLISGFPPPMTYSESPYGLGNSQGGGEVAEGLPKHAHFGPHKIIAFHDYEEGVAYAKQVGKPILLDFTGHACVNCRKMEEHVWSQPEVLSILKNEVVLISLYVDDKRELDEKDKYTSPETGKEIKTIGNKWSDYQITRYKNNAQPFYIVLDSEGKDISSPVGYTPDVEEYKKWLEEGISNFKK
ncbi:protein-disulfide reductase DsbD family protein [Flavobacterium okayamense]|uniref:Thiol:disulfide interchange protein DsbD n=1 Tax=Flavobacterium okayamense TaxID=2830782 RepID=A0ABM7S6N1_9FLAO|nr:thioredoxin family protein [Flavobacterium okayamense]BCY29025.1 thiol:disulfide interchange protein DsbD [Flavobacterium okayamense]